MKTLLITFGCSWTFGVGVGYSSGMTEDEYKKIAWDNNICNEFSFRGILSEKYNCKNINFAHGGSSNQKQFRLAKIFFASDEFIKLQKTYTKIVVLWGITSTARNEMYSLEKNELFNFKYDTPGLQLSKQLIKLSYNHDNEVQQLATEMTFWNDYFNSKGILNLWVDTFNHHQYPTTIKNLVNNDSPYRDLLSSLAIHNKMPEEIDNNYHWSSWRVDSNRVKFLIDCNVLNPISTHPTKLGHRQIADMLTPYIENIL